MIDRETSETLDLSLPPDIDRKLKLQSGRKLVFDAAAPPETRVVLCEWLVEIAENSAKTLRTPIRISSAVLRGKLDLRHCVFEADFVITDSEFTDEVDLSFSSFQREFSLDRCRFIRPFKGNGLQTLKDFDLSDVEFSDFAEFHSMIVGNTLHAKGTHFSKVEFEGTTVHGDAIFTPSLSGRAVIFSAHATFVSSVVRGQADFSSAQFESTAWFDFMRVEGGVFFRRDELREPSRKGAPEKSTERYPPVRFMGEARFLDTRFIGQADFTGTHFGSSASFDGMVVEGDASFGEDDSTGPVTFVGEARFPGVVIHGQANFLSAVFKGSALFRQGRVGEESLFGNAVFHGPFQFDHFRFDGPALFQGRVDTSPARFISRAGFRGVTFLAVARFDGVKFRGPADFDGARFESEANFRNCTFDGETAFAGVVSIRDLCFQGAVFMMPVSLREANCRALFFRDQMTRNLESGADRQFFGSVNLIGLCYDRIYVAWGELLDQLQPFDEQPYSQLERSLRGSGDDASAAEVYVRRRKRALQLYWADLRHKWWPAIRDSAYCLLGFGVRPVRLFGFALALLLISASVFSLPGAVIPKSGFDDFARQLVWIEGVGVAFNLFLPVEVPIGDGWRPADAPIPIEWMKIGSVPITFAFWATVLRIAGWIIVPLGVATIAGVLRRQSRP